MISRIKQTADILDVCERLGLNPNRSAFICCPMHGEKTPSLKIYTDTDTWRCFGCGAYGDVIDLVAGTLNLTQGEAIKTMASWYGLTNKKLSQHDRRKIQAAKNRREREKQARQKKTDEYNCIYNERLRVEAALVNNPPGSLEYCKALAELEHINYRLEVAEFDRSERLDAARNRH